MAELPWVGFAVKPQKGKRSLYVKDVSEGGPADKTGIKDGDELLSFDGQQTYDIKSFRAALKNLSPGNWVKVEIARDLDGKDNAIRKTFTLNVGARRNRESASPKGTSPRPMSIEAVQQILQDRTRLIKSATAAFFEADSDCSGLVSVNEYLQAMNIWLNPSLGHITQEHLRQLFERADVDDSGFLSQSEFVPVIEGIFQLIVSRAYGDTSDASRSLLSGSLPKPNVSVRDVQPQYTPTSTKRDTQSTESSEGKPWLGFAIKKAKQYGGLMVWEVAQDSPAWNADIREGDGVESVAGVPVKDLSSFRRAIGSLHIGETVVIGMELWDRQGRSQRVRKEVKVGRKTRERFDPSSIPPTKTFTDITAILRDSNKLRLLTAVLFTEADADISGLVTVSEYLQAMQKWIDRDLLSLVGEKQLKEVFDQVDVDNSGFLSRNEFEAVVKGLLTLLAGHSRSLEVNTQSNQQHSHSHSSGSSSTVSKPQAHEQPQKGQPWIGWTFKQGKNSLMVVDVSTQSPAFEAGIRRGDEIYYIEGKPMTNLIAYRQIYRGLTVGRKIFVQVLRQGMVTIEIKVGTKQKESFANLPSLKYVEDIQEILDDQAKLKLVVDYAFSDADDDLSGFVSLVEFMGSIRRWMPSSLSDCFSDSDLISVFNRLDVDQSGFLTKSEYQPGLVSLLQMIVAKSSPNYYNHQNFPRPNSNVLSHSEVKMPLVAPEHRRGIWPNHIQWQDITASWHYQGWVPLGGMHCPMHGEKMDSVPHDTLMTVVDGLAMFKIWGKQYNVQPGDEIAIPAHTKYLVLCPHPVTLVFSYRTGVGEHRVWKERSPEYPITMQVEEGALIVEVNGKRFDMKSGSEVNIPADTDYTTYSYDKNTAWRYVHPPISVTAGRIRN